MSCSRFEILNKTGFFKLDHPYDELSLVVDQYVHLLLVAHLVDFKNNRDGFRMTNWDKNICIFCYKIKFYIIVYTCDLHDELSLVLDQYVHLLHRGQ